MKLKSYAVTTPIHDVGEILGSVLVVEVTSPCQILHFDKCCAVCPNRMRKVTGVEKCDITNFSVSRDGFTGHIKEAQVTCKHMVSSGIEVRMNDY